MTYYSRAEWGGRNPSGGPLGPVAVTAIHHTASQNPPHAFDPQRWRNLENGEVAAGYSSLAYHFGVCPSGDIVEIRGWGQKGAATGGHNHDSVAIVFDGYFHPPYSEQPTEAALASAGFVVAQGRARGHLTSINCEGHRTLTAGTQWATACPGDNLFPRIGEIESRAAGGSGPPAASGGYNDMWICFFKQADGRTGTYLCAGAVIIAQWISDAATQGAFGISRHALAWMDGYEKQNGKPVERTTHGAATINNLKAATKSAGVTLG